MAYSLNTCFAKEAKLSHCSLNTVLSVSDDINNSISYYFSEAQRIKDIIDRCSVIDNSSTVSTHDIELARSFSGILDTYHFSKTMVDGEVIFDYKIMPGVEYTRNAISILKKCGYPNEVIDMALKNTEKVCKNMDGIEL